MRQVYGVNPYWSKNAAPYQKLLQQVIAGALDSVCAPFAIQTPSSLPALPTAGGAGGRSTIECTEKCPGVGR